MTDIPEDMDVDALAQEIRCVDGSNSLGAGELAEALMPFIARALAAAEQRGAERERERCAKVAEDMPVLEPASNIYIMGWGGARAFIADAIRRGEG